MRLYLSSSGDPTTAAARCQYPNRANQNFPVDYPIALGGGHEIAFARTWTSPSIPPASSAASPLQPDADLQALANPSSDSNAVGHLEIGGNPPAP
jgi:hypothetical protein